VSWLIEQVLGFPPWLALVLIFLLPAAEASVFAGFIFPGEVVVFFGGVLANEGRLALWTVILVGSLGAIIGDSIGYEVGRHYGMRLLARLPARLVKPDHVTRAQDLIRRKGGRAIFLGRFTAALRVLVPGLAGTSGMPYRRFLLFNVTGGITWVIETTLVGYVAGKSYRAAERRLSLISLGLLAAVVVFVAVKLARRSDRARTILVRIDPTRALGRPLSAVLVTLLGAGWLFGGVAEDVTDREGIALADPGWLHDLVGLRTPWLTDVARAVTDLGQGVLLYPALAVVGLLALRRLGQRRWLVAGLVGLATGQLVRWSVMTSVGRPRPAHEFWLTGAGGQSFPSGHTTTATLGYGLLGYLLWRLCRKRWQRLVLVGTGLVLATAVGASRAYLGVHWVSDVVGGWSLGLFWLALVVGVVQVVQQRGWVSSNGPRLQSAALSATTAA